MDYKQLNSDYRQGRLLASTETINTVESMNEAMSSYAATALLLVTLQTFYDFVSAQMWLASED